MKGMAYLAFYERLTTCIYFYNGQYNLIVGGLLKFVYGYDLLVKSHSSFWGQQLV